VAKRLGEQKGPETELTVGAETFKVDVWFITRAEWLARG
jgi:hypothetical protein